MNDIFSAIENANLELFRSELSKLKKENNTEILSKDGDTILNKILSERFFNARKIFFDSHKQRILWKMFEDAILVCDVNFFGEGKSVPLYTAIMYGDFDTIPLFLNNPNLNFDIQNVEDETILHRLINSLFDTKLVLCATRNRSLETNQGKIAELSIELLKSVLRHRQINVSLINQDGATPLLSAVHRLRTADQRLENSLAKSQDAHLFESESEVHELKRNHLAEMFCILLQDTLIRDASVLNNLKRKEDTNLAITVISQIHRRDLIMPLLNHTDCSLEDAPAIVHTLLSCNYYNEARTFALMRVKTPDQMEQFAGKLLESSIHDNTFAHSLKFILAKDTKWPAINLSCTHFELIAADLIKFNKHKELKELLAYTGGKIITNDYIKTCKEKNIAIFEVLLPHMIHHKPVNTKENILHQLTKLQYDEGLHFLLEQAKKATTQGRAYKKAIATMINEKDATGQTAYHYLFNFASVCKDMQKLKQRIAFIRQFKNDYQADINALDSLQRPAIYYSITNNNFLLFMVSIELKANLNVLVDGKTLLHIALENNYYDMAERLIDYAPQLLKIEDEKHLTPMDYIKLIEQEKSRVKLQETADKKLAELNKESTVTSKPVGAIDDDAVTNFQPEEAPNHALEQLLTDEKQSLSAQKEQTENNFANTSAGKKSLLTPQQAQTTRKSAKVKVQEKTAKKRNDNQQKLTAIGGNSITIAKPVDDNKTKKIEKPRANISQLFATKKRKDTKKVANKEEGVNANKAEEQIHVGTAIISSSQPQAAVNDLYFDEFKPTIATSKQHNVKASKKEILSSVDQPTRELAYKSEAKKWLKLLESDKVKDHVELSQKNSSVIYISYSDWSNNETTLDATHPHITLVKDLLREAYKQQARADGLERKKTESLFILATGSRGLEMTLLNKYSLKSGDLDLVATSIMPSLFKRFLEGYNTLAELNNFKKIRFTIKSNAKGKMTFRFHFDDATNIDISLTTVAELKGRFTEETLSFYKIYIDLINNNIIATISSLRDLCSGNISIDIKDSKHLLPLIHAHYVFNFRLLLMLDKFLPLGGQLDKNAKDVLHYARNTYANSTLSKEPQGEITLRNFYERLLQSFGVVNALKRFCEYSLIDNAITDTSAIAQMADFYLLSHERFIQQPANFNLQVPQQMSPSAILVETIIKPHAMNISYCGYNMSNWLAVTELLCQSDKNNDQAHTSSSEVKQMFNKLKDRLVKPPHSIEDTIVMIAQSNDELLKKYGRRFIAILCTTSKLAKVFIENALIKLAALEDKNQIQVGNKKDY